MFIGDAVDDIISVVELVASVVVLDVTRVVETGVVALVEKGVVVFTSVVVFPFPVVVFIGDGVDDIIAVVELVASVVVLEVTKVVELFVVAFVGHEVVAFTCMVVFLS